MFGMQKLFRKISSLFRLGPSQSFSDVTSAKIENIETALGNEILESLKVDGWKVTKQYSPLAFDKGIDFDSYTLKKDGQRINFEWTNWFEWTIRADQAVIAEINQRINEPSKAK